MYGGYIESDFVRQNSTHRRNFDFFLNVENSLTGLVFFLLLVDNLGKSHIINVVYDCDKKLAEILFASTNSKIGINSNISENE
jgi:hypothetical protein